MHQRLLLALLCTVSLGLAGCERQQATAPEAPPAPRYDGVVLNGTVYDGSGGPGQALDVAIDAGRIVALGDFGPDDGGFVVDASGKAVAPGFINMLSWALDSLIHDGRSQGDIRQGVTLEVFGEGESWGPWNEAMKAEEAGRQGDIRYDIEWTSLGEFLDYLQNRGVSTNIASFIGATTLRVHELGYEDRAPSAQELARMQDLVRQGMEEGALGIGSSLIYAPAYYASTEELIALTSVAAEYGGMYISHLRSEGNRLLEAIEELITIARESGAPAEIYHFKQSGESNWLKFDEAVAMIEAARAEGLRISADMYTYTAGSTGLDAAMPPWVQEGGYAAWAQRLQDADIRARLQQEMLDRKADWSNLMLAAGAEGTLLVGFRNPALRHYTDKTLAEVAAERGTNAQQTAMDLVIEDGSRVQVVYFLMSEDNVKRGIALPWMSFGSDAYSMAPEGVFLNSSTHPRAYGTFARLLGRYVREEQVIPLSEAIRKLTSLPAGNLGLRERGLLAPGYHADVVVFDPATIADHATYDDPHRYATGVSDVIVNGVQVLVDGEHTGATPGQVVRGPGWSGWPERQ
ncbi:N-acyl-D-amino-acid deacylase family protein [Parahaliea mediterranea]|uniref:N-acyl-D-amino-acid deacylase family protein n=1 Tax=Parahaliea mediterranea TaxID=651086 RepID=UPI000E2EB105|nr:D-aminoacylase [Parahaliea mediterranea]